ncbi:hypothetical protein Nepgr_031701 [Nepenthes gracilis]|uniref:Uncharacterized protein n=1 Tax=Nepenthes gracilis TaxID=150966 RepID=A0AAD3TIZ6_NEPGR|nr:hypothetical protein Nepgr_031701 [Nepenthes gracilis]
MIGNSEEHPVCPYTDIHFTYQWKPNQCNRPNKKGPIDPINKLRQVYRPTGRHLVDPLPSSEPKILQKAPAVGAHSSTVPKSTSTPISNSFGALQDPEGEGHIGVDELVQVNRKGAKTQLTSPHRVLTNIPIRNDGCLPPMPRV